MYKHNPKLEGSNIIDCVPQKGPCPNNCNQCFYNRKDVCSVCKGTALNPMGTGYCLKCEGAREFLAFYAGHEPNIPSIEEVGNKIVRMNAGNDSNNERELVIETAKKYKHFFFNTSISRFDFPGPIVFTANPKEEIPAQLICRYRTDKVPDNLMYVRLRVSTSNLKYVDEAVDWYCRKLYVPVILTFMAYYEEEKIPKKVLAYYAGDIYPSIEFLDKFGVEAKELTCYEYKVRHINSYWCPTKEFMSYVLKRMKRVGGRLVTMCGSVDSNWCRDCRNCEVYYWQTLKHMKEV